LAFGGKVSFQTLSWLPELLEPIRAITKRGVLKIAVSITTYFNKSLDIAGGAANFALKKNANHLMPPLVNKENLKQ
jgi:hypothetical protein